MKHGLFTISSIENGRDPSMVKHHKPITRMVSVNYCTNWKQPSTRSGQNWSIAKVSTGIVLDRIHFWPLVKNWESLAGIFWCIPNIALTLHRQTAICFGLCGTGGNGEAFDNDEAIRSHLVQFIADKDQKCYEREKMKLSARWRKIIHQIGKYIYTSTGLPIFHVFF